MVLCVPGFSDKCHVLALIVLWHVTAALHPLPAALTIRQGQLSVQSLAS